MKVVCKACGNTVDSDKTIVTARFCSALSKKVVGTMCLTCRREWDDLYIRAPEHEMLYKDEIDERISYPNKYAIHEYYPSHADSILAVADSLNLKD